MPAQVHFRARGCVKEKVPSDKVFFFPLLLKHVQMYVSLFVISTYLWPLLCPKVVEWTSQTKLHPCQIFWILRHASTAYTCVSDDPLPHTIDPLPVSCLNHIHRQWVSQWLVEDYKRGFKKKFQSKSRSKLFQMRTGLGQRNFGKNINFVQYSMKWQTPDELDIEKFFW